MYVIWLLIEKELEKQEEEIDSDEEVEILDEYDGMGTLEDDNYNSSDDEENQEEIEISIFFQILC